MTSAAMTPGVVMRPPARMDDPRFRLHHALGIAFLLHLLCALFASAWPEGLAVPSLRILPEEAPPAMRFTFIDVPDDHVVERNDEARLISDRARRESGPIPRVTTPEGREPPSIGNTRQRIVRRGEETSSIRDSFRPPTAAPHSAAPEPSTPRGAPRAGGPPTEAGAAARVGGRDLGGDSGQADGGRAGARGGASVSTDRSREAVRELARSLPVDLKAFQPPAGVPSGSPLGNPSTRWNFDNPDPAFPVSVGTLSFDSKGADFGPWLKEFHARVLNEWTRNLQEWHDRVWQDIVGARFASDPEKWNRFATLMNSTRGVTGVTFAVTREGSVVDLQEVSPSGVVNLDRSVQQTLRNVLLQALPPDYPDNTLPIRAGFYYNVDPPER